MDKDKKKTYTFVQKIGICFLLRPFLSVVGIIDYILAICIKSVKPDGEFAFDKDTVFVKRKDPNNPSSPYQNVVLDPSISLIDKNDNLFDEFEKAVKRFAEVKTMGVRELLSVDDEKQPNGKIFKKFSLGSYNWIDYNTLYQKVLDLSNGFLTIGLNSNENVVLFCETRPEWMMTALACFRIKVPIVTLYSTLGTDALTHGINETKASFVITSGEQLVKIQKIISKTPHLKNLVVVADRHTENNVTEFKNKNPSIKVYEIKEVESIGGVKDTSISKTNRPLHTNPKKDDLAIIMYTSGSTGNPKGVMISHGNLLVASRALLNHIGRIKENKDIYVAYLPLAHVLELAAEFTIICSGIRLAYSSPNTLADTSTAIKQGQKGDLRALKPTLMATVPTVLERLSKVVYEKLSKTSWFKQALFKLAYRQKLAAFRAGRRTKLLDRILFRRIRSAVLGGKVRLVLCGGAMLNPEVHEFTQVCLSPVRQAYGLTETCGAGTVQMPNETVTGVVGSIVSCSEIMLVDWPEAGYHNTDTPNPRGEIYISGGNIALGYFNMPEKTDEDFKVVNGVRYFATGDIGEFLPNGNLKVIDRKKDLVKLQGGEYVSLNRIETIIKQMPFVDNCCVIADASKNNCVCIISGSIKNVETHIKPSDSEMQVTQESLDDVDSKVMAKINKDVIDFCLSKGLDRFEIPTKCKIVKDTWMPDTGLVTDSLKLKRREIEKFYKKDIQQLYKEK